MKKSDTSKIEFEKAEKPEARRFVKKFDTSMIVYIGVLTAMEIVLNRFLSINAWNLKIGFSFVPVAIAGMLFGLLPAAIVAALGDVRTQGARSRRDQSADPEPSAQLPLDLCPVRIALSAAAFDEDRSVCGTYSCRDHFDSRVRTCLRQSGR